MRLGSDSLASEVATRAATLSHHRLFAQLRSLAQLRVLMEHHVWAVWDFMSLLKSIQALIAPTTVPWCPPLDIEAARLINEIVVSEEGDDGPQGRPASHFEIYLERHIVIDGDRHGPMAEALFRRICLSDENLRKSSLEIARVVLDARIALWDAVAAAIS